MSSKLIARQMICSREVTEMKICRFGLAITLIVLAHLSVALLSGCSTVDQDKSSWPENWVLPTDPCPTSTTNAYFIPPSPRDGYSFVGLPGYPMGTADDYSLAQQSGYQYYDGATGGVGKSLAIVNYSNGIIIWWQYGVETFVMLFDGWQGQVYISKTANTGIRLGSTATDFQKVFPLCISKANMHGGVSYYAQMDDPTVNRFPFTGTKALVAECDNAGKIRRIVIDGRFTKDKPPTGYNGPGW
jgi:hypothetical protein